MTSRVSVAALGLLTVVAAPELSAAPRTVAECRALVDPAARLACYDAIEGQASVTAPAPVANLPAGGPQSQSAPPRNDSAAAAPAPAAAPVPKHR